MSHVSYQVDNIRQAAVEGARKRVSRCCGENARGGFVVIVQVAEGGTLASVRRFDCAITGELV